MCLVGQKLNKSVRGVPRKFSRSFYKGLQGIKKQQILNQFLLTLSQVQNNFFNLILESSLHELPINHPQASKYHLMKAQLQYEDQA